MYFLESSVTSKTVTQAVHKVLLFWLSGVLPSIPRLPSLFFSEEAHMLRVLRKGL